MKKMLHGTKAYLSMTSFTTPNPNSPPLNQSRSLLLQQFGFHSTLRSCTKSQSTEKYPQIPFSQLWSILAQEWNVNCCCEGLALELEVNLAWFLSIKMAGWWREKVAFIASPVEGRGDSQEIINERAARAKHCTDEGVKAGFKAASIACLASAIPTLTAVRTIPWFKTNINYTGQALIISAATIGTYFIVTEQTIHECSRRGSYDALEKTRSAVS